MVIRLTIFAKCLVLAINAYNIYGYYTKHMARRFFTASTMLK